MPLVCPYHAVEIARGAGEERVVTLDGGEVPADRDFVLRWTPERGSAPRAAVFAETWEGQTYVLAMVLPPASEHITQARPPREIVLVIDTSGSMQGTSIVQARAALKDVLDRLDPEDLFNVIRFDSRMERHFPASRPAMLAALAFAPGHVDGTATPCAPGNCVLAGHRDTTFAFLHRVAPGDPLSLEDPSGAVHAYRVVAVRVVHESEGWVLGPAASERLTLLTRYPFSSPVAGGPLRWVVWADPAEDLGSSRPLTGAKAPISATAAAASSSAPAATMTRPHDEAASDGTARSMIAASITAPRPTADHSNTAAALASG